MCLFPKLIDNPKYRVNKKNGGNIPAVRDYRVLKVPIGCGNCMECRKQKANNWRTRLFEDIKVNNNAKFVTLTFNNDSLINLAKEFPKLDGYLLENQIATKAVRLFLERWRKKYTKSVRHWLVTELGQSNSERIHIHGLIWTDNIEAISERWQYGIVTIGESKFLNGKRLDNNSIGYVNENTINYIVKYVHKSDTLHAEYKSIVLTSAGIGSSYTNTHNAKLNKFNGSNTIDQYTTYKGNKCQLPIYYRNKLYTEEEREQLWLTKLDHQKRFVLGKEIDTSTPEGETNYWKALKDAQRLNKELKYGSDAIDWERKRYENELRSIKMKENAKALSKAKAINNKSK